MRLFLTISIVLGIIGNHFAAGLNVRLVPHQSEAAVDARKLEIINGVPAKSDQFPYYAGIQFPYSTPGSFTFCGGALITNGTILTAASCILIFAEAFPSMIYVTLNSLNFDGSTPGAVRVPVRGVLKHPDFPGPSIFLENDIALIYLKKPITTVAPVKLPCPNSKYDGATAQIAGYGRLGNDSNSSNSLSKLMMTNLTVLTNDACDELQGFITNLKMCAASVGTDVGFNDQGGPLIVNGTAIGISSYSINNGNKYPNFSSVFTRVSSFRSWIDANKRYL